MTNGRLYIGKKSFWSRQKNRKTNRKETKESDWKRYFGSCFPLKDDIKQLGKQFFLREILYLCEYKKEMSFLEMREQYRRNVLLNPRYYNTNIEGRFFCTEKHILDSSMIIRSVAGKSDEWKANKSVLMTGDANPSKRPEVRAKISESLKGVKHPRYGKKNDDEHTAAIVESTRGTTFINNGTRNKRVPHAEVENYEADGWVRGRMKFKHPKQLT